MPLRLLQLTLALALASCGATTSSSSESAATGEVDEAVRCETDADCVVLPSTCCGRCGAATPTDVRALRRDALRRGLATCTGSESCVDCFEETDPRLYAVCRASRCEVVDETGGS